MSAAFTRSEVEAYFDTFVKIFASFDGDKVAELFATPGVALRQDGELRGFETQAAIAAYYQDALDRYAAQSCRSCSYADLEIQPLGALTMEDAIAAFEEQARALANGGVDVLWIETMSSREEVEAALHGGSVTGLPMVCTLSFDTNGSTMMGITPADFVALCRELGPSPAAYGTNCGVGPAEVVAGILGLRGAAHDDDLLVAKANCGIPEFVDGAIRYGGTAQLMAEYACLAVDAGARIIGGCCGTTPDIVRAMRDALDGHERGDTPSLDTVEQRLGMLSAGAKRDDSSHRAKQLAARRSSRRRR